MTYPWWCRGAAGGCAGPVSRGCCGWAPRRSPRWAWSWRCWWCTRCGGPIGRPSPPRRSRSGPWRGPGATKGSPIRRPGRRLRRSHPRRPRPPADPVPGAPSAPSEGEPGGQAPPAAPDPYPALRGEGAYAVLRIPRLGIAVPVAQGVDKRSVLDKGYAGQYPGTAQPGARGNFALAGHRNTHGEPFRRIDRLRAGDELFVDVRGRRHTYVVGKILAETTERDTGVIAPVPRSIVKPGQGYGEPGAYITLTTCTPEYSSRYRLVVWGTLKTSG
ncbi:class E sortase [Streptomyces sp. NPDC058662]|uniref:class E sortase n=1 Tax=Streptomyces sp. NPDC058662 TaxID=3346583 RepID=UPI003668A4FF